MRRIFMRLAMAAILSLACFLGTVWWYQKTGQSSLVDTQQKPVAFVARTKDETLRRPVTRVIWQLITDGEPVYTGEAIRTSSEGEARIQFAESKRFIDLEPDSLIVISKSNDNEISLDLMDGSVQVNQGTTAPGAPEEAGPALTLKSGDSKVDLSKATATLSKSSNGRIDLQVLQGKANVENKGHLKQVDQDLIKILSPTPGKAFYLNPREPKPVLFSWEGIPQGSIVEIAMGSQRKSLKPQGQTQETQLSVPLSAGKHYWKLIARNPETKEIVAESALFRLEVAARVPPELLTPAADEQIAPSAAASLELRWNRPASAKSVHMEIATDDDFSDKILSQDFANEETFKHAFKEGYYYARLSARFENSDQILPGPVRRFRVTKNANPPVSVEWQGDTGEEAQFFFINSPEARLAWDTKQKDQVKSWRLKIAENETGLDSPGALSFETNKTSDKISLPKAGRFVASVEALNEEKHVIASSPLKTFSAQVRPLLPAPNFTGATELDADFSGRLDLKWNAVEGATEYQVTLYDKDGKEMRSTRLKKTSTALQNLLPGEFQVGVVAIDTYGRPSEKVAPRAVRVPASSGLAAPKMKRIKVN